jgi:DNA invertase Pin-like site-specific DNA recombinase
MPGNSRRRSSSRQVGLFIHQQGLDTTTASGRAMFGMLGVFAEYAESVIMRSYALDAERTVAKPIDPAGVWMAAASS